jgi:hypothetical protein
LKKQLVISLVLAMAVVLLLPSIAMAAPTVKFTASGVMTSIDTGIVEQIGNTNNWLVSDRHIQGQFMPNEKHKSLSISGPFVLTYGGIFNLQTQAGNLKGTLKATTATFAVTGQTKPLVFKGEYYPLSDTIKAPLYELTVEGNWIGIQGVKAAGDFDAWLKFVPTPDGHVAFIVDSYFNMDGKFMDKDKDKH